MSVENALQRLLSQAVPVTACETIALDQALGRILGDDIIATRAVPPANNSAMDGFAVRSTDVVVGQPLSIHQIIPAGSPGEPLNGGSAARIFTGGEMPIGADAVLIQEDAEFDEVHLVPKATVKTGENVRPKGQDIQEGAQVLACGQRLGPADLSLLASLGKDNALVYRKLTVAILSTGDELVQPPEALKPGQIYNSNRYALAALLTQMGIAVVDMGIVSDDLDATLVALARAAEQADVIICSGGVSVGDRDFVKEAVTQLGALDVWKLAIKPGKPMAYGHVQNKPFFGLPGNPVSTFVTFEVLARPYLVRLQGQLETESVAWPGQAAFEFKAGARQEYLRVRAVPNGSSVQLIAFKAQGSGVMSSLSWANALAVVAPNQWVRVGDTLPYLLMNGL
ncbi:MAG: molybdopterin molybdotransferase MoeA [Gammaproteobacteria bacterium]|jgi:molybdopterin molybdotransferase|nr:molybdopterin molybdotransferase MoeA [Gammaproteobacteria bacterium]MBT5053344.1 molybdopterin molybdotransferase MoeA [Gammaproteobacteria bacterium]